MSIITRIIVPDLALFDGAAAAGGEGTASGGEAAGAEAAAPQRVVYGKQPETSGNADGDAAKAAEADVAKESDRERRKRYRDMVNGEFKDLYTEDTQRIINRRFAADKPLQERLDAMQPIMDALAYRYGIEDGDTKKISDALNGDIAIWEELADKEGISVDAYIQKRNMAIENRQLHEALERRAREESAQRQAAEWNAQAEALAQKYPEFDAQAEAQNPEFAATLKALTHAKFPDAMERAYKTVHMDEIMKGAIKQTQHVTEQRVTSNVRARGQRPTEAGLGSQSAVIQKDDVTKLTKKDRADIAQRAMRGERISF